VRPVGGLGAAGVLGFSQAGFAAGFAVELGEQADLAAGGVLGGILAGPAVVRGDLGAQGALGPGEPGLRAEARLGWGHG
jgi:hypothetical protein